MLLAVWCFAVPLASMFVIGTAVRGMLGRGKALDEAGWVEVPFVGVAVTVLVLQVQGELDIDSCADLRQQLAAAFVAGVEVVGVDLSQVTWVDQSGIDLLSGAARHLRKAPVHVLGAAHALTHHMNLSAMPDLTVTAAAQSGPLAFERAGIAASDVDMLQLYDSFTITVLLTLEDLGFCKKGEGGPFVEGGRLRFDGPNNYGDDLFKVKQVQDGKWVVVWPREFAAPGARLLPP